MIPEAYRAIVERLEQKTRESKVIWNQVSKDTFAVNFGDYSLSVREYFGEDENGVEDRSIDFRLLDSQGKTIDAFDIWSDDKDFENARELFSAARRKALKVDEALAVLSEVLETSTVVGLQEESAEGEEIPF